MFERFTDRARRVVVLAQEEARGLGHDYIGTEHLLLGLMREEDGLAAQVLASFALTADGVRTAVEERVGTAGSPPRGHIPFTPRAKKVLELSLRQALRLEHDYIGTEHILLGLLAEGEGVAAQILLTSVDGGLERVTDEVMARLAELGTIPKSEGRQIHRIIESAVRERIPEGSHPEHDETVRRLEAIEARLSAIERILRERRGETA